VQRREHILSGCTACEYRVKFSAIDPGAAGQSFRPTSESQENV